RIQEASLSTESFLPAQSESISLIRFHGVAILSPLVRKAPNASDFDQWEMETVYSNSEVRNLNVPATFPNSFPSHTEHSTAAKLDKIAGILPLDNEDQCKTDGIDLARDSEGFNSPKQCDS
ncbi:centriolar coiled-coil protein 110, partial [Homo sapiens]